MPILFLGPQIFEQDIRAHAYEPVKHLTDGSNETDMESKGDANSEGSVRFVPSKRPSSR